MYYSKQELMFVCPVAYCQFRTSSEKDKLSHEEMHAYIVKEGKSDKCLTFEAYESDVLSLGFYPNKGNNIVYPVLGITGEAGEIADKVKKVQRDKKGILSEEDRKALIKELGDVLWYITAMADELDISLEEVAYVNIQKIHSRRERGTLSGEGDDR